jgi:predicted ester cyclase
MAEAEADFVAKHTGEFAGIAATGREVTMPYCVVYDLADEKITALRLYFPTDVLLHQIGAKEDRLALPTQAGILGGATG